MFTLVVVCFVFIIFPADSSDTATGPVQSILVNKIELQVHHTHQSEKKSAYIAVYQYADGDVVNVICINFFNQTAHMMEYVMAGKKSDETDMNVISKTLHLTAKDDNTKIVCHFKEQLKKGGGTKEDYVMREIRETLCKGCLFTTTINPADTILPTPEREAGPASGEKSRNSYTLVYYLTAAGVSVIILLVILYLTVKKSCRCNISSSEEIPPPRPHPDTVFYENLLSVFRPINEREAAELENHYEEIE